MLSEKELADIIAQDLDVAEMVDVSPSELRRLRSERIARRVIAAQTREFKVGDRTLQRVFRPAGLKDVSDMQAVLDAVELALEGPDRVRKPLSHGGDAGQPVEASSSAAHDDDMAYALASSLATIVMQEPWAQVGFGDKFRQDAIDAMANRHGELQELFVEEIQRTLKPGPSVLPQTHLEIPMPKVQPPKADPAPEFTIGAWTLEQWRQFARRDDCLHTMVPSDLRLLISAITDPARVADLEQKLRTANEVATLTKGLADKLSRLIVTYSLEAKSSRERADLYQQEFTSAYNVLNRAYHVLFNMAQENKGAIFRRWPIHHEPLRHDARNLLPLIDEVLGHD